jgi:hypothetical protein
MSLTAGIVNVAARELLVTLPIPQIRKGQLRETHCRKGQLRETHAGRDS